MASGSNAPEGQRTSDAPQRPSLDGRATLGKYEIVRQLGAGGMGTVYLAVDSQLKRTVALKVLPKERTENDTLVRRFEAEAQSAAQLKHENIVTIYDAGRADGHLFIALEFVEGTDIYDLVARRGPLPLKRSINFIKQVDACPGTPAQAGLRPPRHQAVQHPGHQGGDGQADRHGPGPSGRRIAQVEHHPRGDDRRHGRLHGAGAGQRQPVRRYPQRHLFARMHVVSNADRRAALSDRKRHEQALCAHLQAAARPPHLESGGSGRDRRHRAPHDGANRPIDTRRRPICWKTSRTWAPATSASRSC